ncbi:MAG TPA: hypothetical protein VHD56_12300 [Tepidisphaeraceae bacterium]|nr:hypothetical protein [Tepidisphaeraceae bacterium]
MTQSSTLLPSSPVIHSRDMRWRWLAMPMVLLSLAYLFVGLHSAVTRARQPWPMSPWESSIIVDCWRVLHHRPIYVDPASGQSTYMYGPLGIYLNVPLVAAFGWDVRLTRLPSLAMGLALCIAASWLLGRGDWITHVLILSFSFMQFYRNRDWAVEARPDAALLFFSFIAIVLFYRAHRDLNLKNTFWQTLFGAATLLIGFFFKQTALAAGLIPILAVILSRPSNFSSRLLIAFIPLAACGFAVVILKLFFPMTYLYMVKVPSSYPVPLGTCFEVLIELVRLSPLGSAAFFAWAMMSSQGEKSDPVDQWLLGSVVILGLAGCAARAKYGGYFNSHLPASMALALFAARVFPQLFQKASKKNWSILFGGAIALLGPLLLIAEVSAMTRTLLPGKTTPEHGDSSYRQVIATVQSLPGQVICPDDPTIPLIAKGYAGHSGQCDLDANDQTLPLSARRELRDADWVIQVAGSSRRPVIASTLLSRMGFVQDSQIQPGNTMYVFWRKPENAVMETPDVK